MGQEAAVPGKQKPAATQIQATEVRLAQQPAQSTPLIHHFQFPPSFLIRARRGESDFTQPALTPHFWDFNTGDNV